MSSVQKRCLQFAKYMKKIVRVIDKQDTWELKKKTGKTGAIDL